MSERVPYPPPLDEERFYGALRRARTRARETASAPGRGIPGALEDIARYLGMGLADTYNAGRRAVTEDPWGTAGGMAADLLTFPTTREIAGGLGPDPATWWRAPAAAGMAAMEAPGPVGALRVLARRSLRPLMTRSVAGQAAAFGPLMVAAHDPVEMARRGTDPFEDASMPYRWYSDGPDPYDEQSQAFAPLPPDR